MNRTLLGVMIGLLLILTACQSPLADTGTRAATSSLTTLQLQAVDESVLSQEFSQEIEIIGRSFFPEEITVLPGTTVRWINRDNMTHAPAGEEFSAPERERGEWFEHTFTRPGVYGYNCRLHPGMDGKIRVTS